MFKNIFRFFAMVMCNQEKAMPYSAEHKAEVRKRIVEKARILFNRHGFEGVSIDQIMAEAGLTRGGFYNHFRNKEELYSEAVSSFLHGRGKIWRDEAGVDPMNGGPQTVQAMIRSYLSSGHLNDLDGHCPMIALPSDVARATPEVRSSYESLLRAMVGLFQHNMDTEGDTREKALVLASVCVGTMILSRTVEDSALADELRSAAGKFTKAYQAG